MPWLTASFHLTAAPSPTQLAAHPTSNISLLSAILRACHQKLRLPVAYSSDGTRPLYASPPACPTLRRSRDPPPVRSLSAPVFFWPATSVLCLNPCLVWGTRSSCRLSRPQLTAAHPPRAPVNSSASWHTHNCNCSYRRLVSVLRRTFHVVVAYAVFAFLRLPIRPGGEGHHHPGPLYRVYPPTVQLLSKRQVVL